ncbi:hypothetical protein B0H34DRAFT_714007 [Crassisporium funariophilum]|nr:hypothetical protein B0H34DRAFT_714007 [Crassisporium funariophilum]
MSSIALTFDLILQFTGDTRDSLIGPFFVGPAVAFVLHGLTCCQSIHYFRTFDHDRRATKWLVGLVWLAETVTVLFIAVTEWMFLIYARGSEVDLLNFIIGEHWSMSAVSFASAITCMPIEAFFITRIYMFADRKKLAALVYLPFAAGWACCLYYNVESASLRNWTKVARYNDFLLAGYCLRFVTDGIITIGMCLILKRKSVDASERAGTMRLVRSIIVWTLSIGLVVWIYTGVFVFLYFGMKSVTIGGGFYITRSGVYANAMLALLNSRERSREIANETIPLDMVDSDFVCNTPNFETTKPDDPQR